MKRSVVTTLIFCIVISLGSCQTKNKEIPDKKKPEITFEEISYDFGNIIKGSEAIHEFIFENTGKKPLMLENVKSSCGCTVPTWTKEPVRKRKTGVIKVEYNTNVTGAFSKSIRIFSNAKNSPVVLRIKGKVIYDSAAAK